MTRETMIHVAGKAQDGREGAPEPAPPGLRRRALIVLGTHRCGTSAVTRVLSLLGADLPGDLTKPVSPVNDSRFWESVELADLNDEVLESAGSFWDDISEVSSSWYASPAFPVFRERAVGILRRELAQSAFFVLKDPRICKLVPFWVRSLKAFGAEPFFVISIRNPLAAAASLKARDALLPAKSYLLWLRHLVEAERHTRSYRRCFVSHERLLEDWRRVTDHISRDLGLEWSRLSLRSELEVEYLLAQGFGHRTFSPEDVETRREVPDWVKCAYRAAVAATRGEETDISETFDRIRSELNAADRIFGTLVVQGRYLASKNEKLARKAKELESIKTKLIRQHGEIERLGTDLAVKRGHSAALNQKVVRLTGDVKATRGEVEYWSDRWKQSEEAVERLKGEAEYWSDRWKQSEEAVERLRGEVEYLNDRWKQSEEAAERLKGEVEYWNDRWKQSEEAAERLKGEVEERNDRWKQSREAVERLKGEVEERNDRWKQSEEAVERLKGEVEYWTDRWKQSEEAAERLKGEVEERNDRWKQSGEAVERLKGKLEEWNDRWKQSEEVVERLKEDLSIREASIRDYEEKAAQMEKRHAELGEYAARLQEKVDFVKRIPLAEKVWRLFARRADESR